MLCAKDKDLLIPIEIPFQQNFTLLANFCLIFDAVNVFFKNLSGTMPLESDISFLKIFKDEYKPCEKYDAGR